MARGEVQTSLEMLGGASEKKGSKEEREVVSVLGDRQDEGWLNGAEKRFPTPL